MVAKPVVHGIVYVHGAGMPEDKSKLVGDPLSEIANGLIDAFAFDVGDPDAKLSLNKKYRLAVKAECKDDKDQPELTGLTLNIFHKDTNLPPSPKPAYELHMREVLWRPPLRGDLDLSYYLPIIGIWAMGFHSFPDKRNAKNAPTRILGMPESSVVARAITQLLTATGAPLVYCLIKVLTILSAIPVVGDYFKGLINSIPGTGYWHIVQDIQTLLTDSTRAAYVRYEIEKQIVELSKLPGMQTIHVLAHSFGTVVAFDTLAHIGKGDAAHEDLNKTGRRALAGKIKTFVTFGSPLEKIRRLAESIKQIVEEEEKEHTTPLSTVDYSRFVKGVTLPNSIENWLNFYSDHDYCSDPLESYRNACSDPSQKAESKKPDIWDAKMPRFWLKLLIFWRNNQDLKTRLAIGLVGLVVSVFAVNWLFPQLADWIQKSGIPSLWCKQADPGIVCQFKGDLTNPGLVCQPGIPPSPSFYCSIDGAWLRSFVAVPVNIISSLAFLLILSLGLYEWWQRRGTNDSSGASRKAASWLRRLKSRPHSKWHNLAMIAATSWFAIFVAPLLLIAYYSRQILKSLLMLFASMVILLIVGMLFYWLVSPLLASGFAGCPAPSNIFDLCRVAKFLGANIFGLPTWGLNIPVWSLLLVGWFVICIVLASIVSDEVLRRDLQSGSWGGGLLGLGGTPVDIVCERANKITTAHGEYWKDPMFWYTVLAAMGIETNNMLQKIKEKNSRNERWPSWPS